jgi:hypothetical protein
VVFNRAWVRAVSYFPLCLRVIAPHTHSHSLIHSTSPSLFLTKTKQNKQPLPPSLLLYFGDCYCRYLLVLFDCLYRVIPLTWLPETFETSKLTFGYVACGSNQRSAQQFVVGGGGASLLNQLNGWGFCALICRPWSILILVAWLLLCRLSCQYVGRS